MAETAAVDGVASPPVYSTSATLRAAFGVVLAGGMSAVITQHAWYRGVEVALAARFVHAVLGVQVGVVRARDMFVFRLSGGGPAHFMGLGLSLGCSSLLLVAPAVLATVMLIFLSRTGLARLLVALALAVATVTGTNFLRLALIAGLVNAWGVDTGFGWGHSFFGTVLTLAGMSLAAYLYVATIRARLPWPVRLGARWVSRGRQ